MPKEFKIKYIKAHDFKSVVATGIYGGVTPQGLLNGHFFIDRVTIPDFETLTADDKGQVVGLPATSKDSDGVREVQFGVLLDLETAKSIVGWMTEKIVEQERVLEVQRQMDRKEKRA